MQSLALYIHWPFCKAKCPYCDFNSHVREQIEESQWQQAFVQELKRLYDNFPERQISSVFFGGGTPSLMSPELVRTIVETIDQQWGLEITTEVTLEANPTSVELAKLKDFHTVGINRLSLGIQSFDDQALKFLGRQHSACEAIQALEMAQNTFSRFSFDLIYARPQQSIVEWQQELQTALEFKTTHLSLYQLTIEPNTAFATRFDRGDFQLPAEDLAAELFDYTVGKLHSRGLEHYEISNFATPGQESQHNLSYWRYLDYAGIGPGAHGRLTTADGRKWATRQYKAPETWLKNATTATGTQERLSVSVQEQAAEMLLMGLRLKQAFDTSNLPVAPESVIDMPRLTSLVNARLLKYDGRLINLSSQARRCLNEILRYIIK